MSWRDDVRRANETLGWIEARQGPLKPDGYARVETTVGQVRAMAEGQDDARISEIRARHTPKSTVAYTHPKRRVGGREIDVCASCYEAWPCDTAYLLAPLDALAAERDARIKTLENDLEHALASVGAFRQAIETIFAKAEEHEIEQGGMIVTYVLPCGPLHRAIGLARGTDAGGKLLKRLSDTEAERDAAVARAERAEELLRTMAGVHCDPKCSSVGHFKLCAQARATLAAASDSISHSGESSRLSE